MTPCHYGDILLVEVLDMVRMTLRLPDELHEKIRWLAYTQRRSQNDILLETLVKALADVEVPKEERK